MHEFPLDEAMGYNRRQQMDAVAHLANAGLDDRPYDNDDFFANRPEPGGQQDGTIIERRGSFAGSEAGGDQQDVDVDPEMDNGEDDVVRVRDDDASDAGDEADMDSLAQEGGSQNGRDSEYQSARSHQSLGGQGLIQEEPVDAPVQAPMQAPVPQNAGLIQPAGPVTHYSSEPDNEYRENEWLPRRSNKVFGKYWKTFGERQRATGGGVTGFFKALFGKGMARANRAAARTAYDTAQLTRARGLRAQQRQADETRGPLRSALRTRLANPEPITKLSTFPREPGVQYDEAAAGAANAEYMNARRQFQAFDEVLPAQGFMNQTMYNNVALRMTGERDVLDFNMKAAYRNIDRQTGTRRLFKLPFQNPDLKERTAEKHNALIQANLTAGADSVMSANRPRNQRVRFKDGADDNLGLPVNDPNESYENKPMPTGVHFFPAPIGSRTLEASARQQLRQFEQSDEFTALTEAQQAARKAAKEKELADPISEYVDSLGAVGHPDEISDQQAVANERYAWPIRAAMSRQRTDALSDTESRHLQHALGLEQQARQSDADPLESDAFRDEALRYNIAGEALANRTRARQADAAHREHRRMPVGHLPDRLQPTIRGNLQQLGYPANPPKLPEGQVERLPVGYFDHYFKRGKAIAAEQKAKVEAARGAGGAGLIEEEEPQQ